MKFIGSALFALAATAILIVSTLVFVALVVFAFAKFAKEGNDAACIAVGVFAALTLLYVPDKIPVLLFGSSKRSRKK